MPVKTFGFDWYPENIAKSVDIPDWSLPSLLDETVLKYPNKISMSFYGKTITYEAFQKSVYAFASNLQGQGVQKGDRVAILLPNCPQYVISYYGILAAGGIVTQLNPMLVERELEEIVADAGAKWIVTLDSLHAKVKSVQSKSNLESIIVVSFTSRSVSCSGDYSFDTFIQGEKNPYKPVQINPAEDVAVLQYTGGTTGKSKGAMLTHRNLIANVIQSYEFFKEELEFGKERVLTVIPLFHVFGMTSCMNLSVYLGSNMILLPKFSPDEVLQTIEREKPTTFPGVPTMYVALTNLPDIKSHDVKSIRVCNSGSAPMPAQLLKDFESKTGAMILEGFGLSEASPTTHCNPPFAARKPGSIGIGLPSTEYKIVDPETGTTEMPIGEPGELIVKGPQVMKGYWNLPKETEKALRDGWLFTGDIAKEDEDGYVYIVDRKKDLIIASGYNVYPREIEEVIYEYPAVKEAAVIGISDSYRGESVKAIIVLKEGEQATIEDVRQYCKANLAPYKVPKLIEFRKELPKSNIGKVLKRMLREEESTS